MNLEKIKNNSEHMLLHLSMVFNFEYDFSLKWIKENHYIDKMFEMFKEKKSLKSILIIF